jgi:N-acetylglucosaminyldiphosphoundecaprenol N-acetyl-beta-D-mannosaminyltransferase
MSGTPLPEAHEVLGCPVHPLTIDETVAWCDAWRRGPRVTHHITTVNVANLAVRSRHLGLRHAYDRADLTVPDGVPILWASRLLGSPLPGRVAGIELMERLLEHGSRNGWRFSFLGARQEVVDELLRRLPARYPGIVVASARHGYFDLPDEAAVIDEIRAAEADVLFIALPTPHKEVWAQQHRAALATPIVVGVGGSFDVIAGFVRRAPVWIQRIGCEWAWRLAQEPQKLWKRYLTTNAWFAWRLSRALAGRIASGRRTAPGRRNRPGIDPGLNETAATRGPSLRRPRAPAG